MRKGWAWESKDEMATYCYACERTLEEVGTLDEVPLGVGQPEGAMVCEDCLSDSR